MNNLEGFLFNSLRGNNCIHESHFFVIWSGFSNFKFFYLQDTCFIHKCCTVNLGSSTFTRFFVIVARCFCMSIVLLLSLLLLPSIKQNFDLSSLETRASNNFFCVLKYKILHSMSLIQKQHRKNSNINANCAISRNFC